MRRTIEDVKRALEVQKHADDYIGLNIRSLIVEKKVPLESLVFSVFEDRRKKCEEAVPSEYPSGPSFGILVSVACFRGDMQALLLPLSNIGSLPLDFPLDELYPIQNISGLSDTEYFIRGGEDMRLSTILKREFKDLSYLGTVSIDDMLNISRRFVRHVISKQELLYW